MSSRVRLLPAVIGAASVLLMLRVGAIASSAQQSSADAPKAAATDATAGSAAPVQAVAANAPQGAAPAQTADAGAQPLQTTAAACPSSVQPAFAPAGQAQTKGEAEVLQNLSQRRAELDARERDLAMREQLMGATEKQVDERVAELKGLETKLNGMLAQRDAAEQARITSLVKTYENMKPVDAAKIFNRLDRQVMLMVAEQMKPAKIGAVMAAMEAVRAQELTVMLATRMNLSKPAPVELPAAPPPPVPASPQAAAPEAVAPSAPPPA